MQASASGMCKCAVVVACQFAEHLSCAAVDLRLWRGKKANWKK